MKAYVLTLIAAIISIYLIVSNNHQKTQPIYIPPPITRLEKVKMCMLDDDCKLLTEVAYYEARGEPELGIVAVMNVVKNRMNYPSNRFPSTLQAVVGQKCEFSYRCDKSMNKKKDLQAWDEMAIIAYDFQQGNYILNDNIHFYHSVNVRKKPKFARVFPETEKIGKHVFYECNTKYC